MTFHIQTFIYLFAPICSNIRESDFMQNLRLENGKQIWEALWENRHPDAECFITPVSRPFLLQYSKCILVYTFTLSRSFKFHFVRQASLLQKHSCVISISIFIIGSDHSVSVSQFYFPQLFKSITQTFL